MCRRKRTIPAQSVQGWYIVGMGATGVELPSRIITGPEIVSGPGSYDWGYSVNEVVGIVF
jgi:hypothetical protein